MYEDHGGTIFNTITGQWIPQNQKNRHFREYQRWVADGNSAVVVVPPVVVDPDEVMVAELTAANSVPALKAALIKRFS